MAMMNKSPLGSAAPALGQIFSLAGAMKLVKVFRHIAVLVPIKICALVIVALQALKI